MSEILEQHYYIGNSRLPGLTPGFPGAVRDPRGIGYFGGVYGFCFLGVFDGISFFGGGVAAGEGAVAGDCGYEGSPDAKYRVNPVNYW